MTTQQARLLSTVFLRVVMPFALLTAVLIGLGFLRTCVLVDIWPFTGEDPAVRAIAAMRTPTRDRVSDVVSLAAYTPGLTVVLVAAAGAMRVIYQRWREFLFVAAAMLAQLGVYMLTARVVARARPPVPELDDFPPARSFPSGHVAAAIAVYCGIAVVISMRSRRKGLAVVWWIISLSVVLAVAISRVYRGMHYPSDVAASFVVGFGCLWILQRAMLKPVEQRGIRES